jgi:hypothetical protein
VVLHGATVRQRDVGARPEAILGVRIVKEMKEVRAA